MAAFESVGSSESAAIFCVVGNGQFQDNCSLHAFVQAQVSGSCWVSGREVTVFESVRWSEPGSCQVKGLV